MKYWARSYYAGDNLWCQALVPARDGGLVMAGNASSPLLAGTLCSFLVMKLWDDGTIDWQKVYSHQRHSCQATCIHELDDGYVVAGFTEFEGKTAPLVIRLDARGHIVWEHVYFSPFYNTLPGSLVDAGDGGVVVAGRIEPAADADMETLHELAGPIDQDFWVMKLDGQGEIVWQRAFDSKRPLPDGRSRETATSIARIDTHGFILAGNHEHAGGHDIWVVRLDAQGNANAATPFGQTIASGQPSTTLATSIIVTGSDTYALTGFTNDSKFGSFSVLAMEFMLTPGSCIFKRAYDLSDQADYGYGIAKTPHGQFVVAGTFAASRRRQDGFLLTLAPNGDVSRARAYGGDYDDKLYCVRTPAFESDEPRLDYSIVTGGVNKSFPAKPAPSLHFPPWHERIQDHFDNAWVMHLDRHGDIDSRNDHSCLIHDIRQVVSVDLSWSCHCQTDVIPRTPPLERRDIEPAVERYASQTVLLCDEL